MDGRTAPGVTDPEVSHITARTVTPDSRPSSCPGTLRTGERHETLGRNPPPRPRREPRDGDARRRRRDRLRPGVPGPVGVAAPGRPAAYLLLRRAAPAAMGRTGRADPLATDHRVRGAGGGHPDALPLPYVGRPRHRG